MNTGIIVAAGSGTRFGGSIPKQFVEILGKPVLIHTLERFENCELIDQIILVLPDDRVEGFERLAKEFGIVKLRSVVRGGKTRAESVLNGLIQIDGQPEDIIAVHDGARPLVASAEISQTIASAQKTGAACLVGKVNDTIKSVAGGRITGTIDREHLRRALTPQCFRLDVLKRAFSNSELLPYATDECFLIEKLGFEIAFVEGSARNIKITTEDDLKLAELLLRN